MRSELDEAKELVATVLQINVKSIDDSADLFALGLVNSVDFVELVMLIERKTQNKLTLENILGLTSVREIALLIKNKQ